MQAQRADSFDQEVEPAWRLHTKATAIQMRRQRYFSRFVSVVINLLGVVMIFTWKPDLKSVSPSFHDARRLAVDRRASSDHEDKKHDLDSHASSQKSRDLPSIDRHKNNGGSNGFHKHKDQDQHKDQDEHQHTRKHEPDAILSGIQEALHKADPSRKAWRRSWYLPPLPDLYGIQGALTKAWFRWPPQMPRIHQWFCMPPNVIFADLRHLSEHEEDVQYRYYFSAICISFVGYSIVGIVATLIRNCRQPSEEEKKKKRKEEEEEKRKKEASERDKVNMDTIADIDDNAVNKEKGTYHALEEVSTRDVSEEEITPGYWAFGSIQSYATSANQNGYHPSIIEVEDNGLDRAGLRAVSQDLEWKDGKGVGQYEDDMDTHKQEQTKNGSSTAPHQGSRFSVFGILRSLKRIWFSRPEDSYVAIPPTPFSLGGPGASYEPLIVDNSVAIGDDKAANVQVSPYITYPRNASAEEIQKWEKKVGLRDGENGIDTDNAAKQEDSRMDATEETALVKKEPEEDAKPEEHEEHDEDEDHWLLSHEEKHGKGGEAVLYQDSCFIGTVVFVWFTIYVVAMPALVRYGCISTENAFSGEAWLIWLNLHCAFGLLEVFLSMWQTDKAELELWTYPASMLKTLMPFVSEKFDAVKDFMVASLAIYQEDQILNAIGYFCFVLMFVSHFIFVRRVSSMVPIQEAYIPIILADARKVSKDGWCDYIYSLPEKQKEKFAKFLLKQRSEGKITVAVYEDFPQALANVYFQLHDHSKHTKKKGNGFILLTLCISVGKIVVCTIVAWAMKDWLKTILIADRDKAVGKKNYPKAVSLTKEIWSLVDPNEDAKIFKDNEVPIVTLIGLDLPLEKLRKMGYGDPEGGKTDYEQLLERKAPVKDMVLSGFNSLVLFKAAKFPVGLLVEDFKSDKVENFSPKDFREAEYTAEDIKGFFRVDEMLGIEEGTKEGQEGFYPATELTEFYSVYKFKKDAKYTVAMLYHQKLFLVEEIFKEFNVKECEEGDIPREDLIAAGATVKNYKDDLQEGVKGLHGKFPTIEIMKEFNMRQCIDGGIPGEELKTNHADAARFRRAGFGISELSQLKMLDEVTGLFSTKEIRAAFTLKECLDGDISAEALKKSGVGVKDFAKAVNKGGAGYGVEDLYRVTLDGTNLFDIAAIRTVFELKPMLDGGIPPKELAKANFTAKQFKLDAGWSAAKCHGIFSFDQLTDAFDAEEFIGYPLTELRKHYTAQELKDAKFTIDALEEEFTDLELSRCNFTPEELLTANVDIVRMHRNFNISLRELVKPKHKVKEEHFKNNFTVRDFLEEKDKFSFGEILKIGFNKPEDFEEVQVTTKTKPGEKGSIEIIKGTDPNFELYVNIENSDRLVKETPNRVDWVPDTGKKSKVPTSSALQ